MELLIMQISSRTLGAACNSDTVLRVHEEVAGHGMQGMCICVCVEICVCICICICIYMWRWKYVCAYVYIHVMYTYMVAGQAEVRQERLHGMQGMRMCVCGFMCVHMCSVWMYVCAYV